MLAMRYDLSWIKVKYSYTRSGREVNGDCVKELIA